MGLLGFVADRTSTMGSRTDVSVGSGDSGPIIMNAAALLSASQLHLELVKQSIKYKRLTRNTAEEEEHLLPFHTSLRLCSTLFNTPSWHNNLSRLLDRSAKAMYIKSHDPTSQMSAISPAPSSIWRCRAADIQTNHWTLVHEYISPDEGWL